MVPPISHHLIVYLSLQFLFNKVWFHPTRLSILERSAVACAGPARNATTTAHAALLRFSRRAPRPGGVPARYALEDFLRLPARVFLRIRLPARTPRLLAWSTSKDPRTPTLVTIQRRRRWTHLVKIEESRRQKREGASLPPTPRGVLPQHSHRTVLPQQSTTSPPRRLGQTPTT